MNERIDDYVDDFFGWHGETAAMLRREILKVSGVTEDFKWGTPIFEGGGGPICLFKVHTAFVNLGFWRGQQMMELEPRLVPSGSYRMADVKLTGPNEISPDQLHILVRAGLKLNERHGNPLSEKMPPAAMSM